MKTLYILPSFDSHSHEHYAHVVGFLEEVARKTPLSVVVERARGTPEIPSAEHVVALPPLRPAARMIWLAAVLAKLRLRGYKKVFVRISIPAGLVVGTVGRLLGMRSYYWNSGQGKNLAPPWRGGAAALFKRLRYEAALIPFYLTTRLVHRFVTGPASMGPYYSREYGVPSRKVVILANDINVAQFSASLTMCSQRDAKARYGLAEGNLVLLFVGRISPLKGGMHILPIAERVLPTFPEAHILVIGDIHLPTFQRDLDCHPLRDRIHAMGAMPNKDIAVAFRAADLFILPSNSEGFPRVILECMAAGLPFVGFDVGGVRELTPDEQQAYVAPPQDVGRFAELTAELLASPERRQLLGRANLEAVLWYDTPRVVDMFLERIVAS
jgi:glycosyltransferase involved in cell wall biosynthesis